MEKEAIHAKALLQTSSTVTPLLSPRTSLAHSALLGERVYSALKHDIVHGFYQPGEPLNGKALADRYKGSRTPVREAAVRLQNERLLRIIPNRGYFVTQITLQALHDIYEYRCAVECSAAELAAIKHPDPETLKLLVDLSRVTCRTEDREGCIRFVESDTAFHLAIARLSRNQMLVQAVSESRSQMERLMYAAIDINYYGEQPGKEHHEILRAILDRDPERARREMYGHIMQSRGKVLNVTVYGN